jgi:hypothetical protein
MHQFLDGILEQVREGLDEEYRLLVETGDLVGEPATVSWMNLPHECHLFTWEQVDGLLARRPCRLLAASASNFLSIRAEQALSALSSEEWERLIAWEERACGAPGALDAGTHILVAIEKQAR